MPARLDLMANSRDMIIRKTPRECARDLVQAMTQRDHWI
uniref:Uncharacterized protein n=1 Tax=Picea sitchensis TaxID=3332 RepID=A9NNG1_PICSI|nr:unknown [Picea sitchensis]